MLLPEHASNPEMVQRFLRECEMVSLIEHANVVRIYDFGEAEAGVLYIAMELVPGSSLASVIHEEGAFEPERALHAFAQICRGVAAVHDRGIVHRDLKPDNLRLPRRRRRTRRSPSRRCCRSRLRRQWCRYEPLRQPRFADAARRA
jgi:serine/threonine-protein kinase